MGAKRQATTQGAHAAKKAKIDPVSKKVKEVLDAIQREDCDVGGTPRHVEGLVAGFPLAMGLGAAKDERHEYQERVGNLVLEILQANEIKFGESHKAAKEEHAAAETVKSAKEAAVTETTNTLASQQTKESCARETHSSSSAAVVEARKKFEETTSAVDDFDSLLQVKAKVHMEYRSVLQKEFESLKTGKVEDGKEKKIIFSTVKATLEKLDVDKGMITSADPALNKAPGLRGDFDYTVVEHVENALKKKVDSLTEELNNGEVNKAEKVAEKEAAEEALKAAQAKTAEDQIRVSEAEAKTKELQATLREAKRSLEEQEKILSDLDIKAFYQQCHAQNFHDAILAFEFLRDRVSSAPEAEAEPEILKESAMEADEDNIPVVVHAA